jgi:hypothetical protein
MHKSIVTFDREFQIWNYTTSHGQLLLRSPKAAGRPTRVDVLFSDVRAIELRASLPTLAIEEVEPNDVAERATKPSDTMESGHKIFLLKCSDWIGCVVAGAVHWHEDQAEYGQPSALLSGTRL